MNGSTDTRASSAVNPQFFGVGIGANESVRCQPSGTDGGSGLAPKTGEGVSLSSGLDNVKTSERKSAAVGVC